MASDFVRMTGLWEKDSSKGGTYLSGKVNKTITLPAGSKIFIFHNDRADTPGDPQRIMSYVLPDADSPEAVAEQAHQENNKKQSAPF